ncbi:MAG: hypothetical protein COW84_04445 [Gammaproteobacteria bacterium CG22_combo_CG10-13_8_21_14_all_40_8]|nr:MAG: hypothetical protein COW84_04445 [Gammaproteobacteria bacterium CG22_combo_CG10-13_8_21_14_all_40_8]
MMRHSILAIDDSPVQRSLYNCFIGKTNDLLFASLGADAIQKAQNHKFDLIICDMHLPDMDGVEIITKIRQMPLHKTTLIIVVSSDAEGGKQAMNVGAKFYVLKPVDPKTFLVNIDKLIANYQASLAR